MPNCVRCNEKFSNRMMIDGRIHNISKRKFCLKCSPFKSKNTRSLADFNFNMEGVKVCPSCKTEKPKKDFYVRRQGTNLSPYCIKCTSLETKNRQNQKKILAVEFKGGCCVLCGYNRCSHSMHFHHLKPSEKSYDISDGLRRLSFEEVKQELLKCILVCSNCHGEIEAGILEIPAEHKIQSKGLEPLLTHP